MNYHSTIRPDVKIICTKNERLWPYYNDLAFLPPSFELHPIRAIPVSAHENYERRKAFDGSVKADFLRYLAQYHQAELIAMGLTARDIARMNTGFLPYAGRHRQRRTRFDGTIDHIISLNVGGTNAFANLALIPNWVNQLKNELEKAQAPEQETPGTLSFVTIFPVHGLKVPIVDGGFRVRRLTH